MSTPKTDNSNERESAAQMIIKGAMRDAKDDHPTLDNTGARFVALGMIAQLLTAATDNDPYSNSFAKEEVQRLIELSKGV